jgi:hypothetical protein
MSDGTGKRERRDARRYKEYMLTQETFSRADAWEAWNEVEESLEPKLVKTKGTGAAKSGTKYHSR